MSDAQTTSPVGVSSMVAPLRRVPMRRPGPSTVFADPVRWHYAHALDAAAVAASHAELADLVAGHGAEVVWLADDDGDGLADGVFTYDPSLVSAAGAVLLRMGKELRRPEVELHERLYDRLGVPILGRIEPPGTVEGGDCCWLDATTLVVGRGFRTNQPGIEQLRAGLAPHGVRVHSVDLPVGAGPQACLHLLSLLSPLDDDLALVDGTMLPVALHQLLEARGVTMLPAPRGELVASGGLSLNVLATAPRRCIAIDGYPATAALLRGAGCQVDVYDGTALSIPCEGGPTCLTRPLLRA